MSISERADPRNQRRQRERRKPDFNCMVRVGNGWTKIGAAWRLRSGEDGYSIQIVALPLPGWDGRFSLFVPDTIEDTDPQPNED